MPRHNAGPRLQLNDRGVYEIRWTEDGRSRRLSTRTGHQAEAQRVFAGWLDEAQAEEEGRSRLTIAECLERYESDHVDSGEVADPQRQRDILVWLRAGVDGFVDEIDDRRLAQYLDARVTGRIGRNGRPAAQSTVRRELSTLRAAINHCRRQRLLSADDVPYIRLPSDSAPRDFWLDEGEARQLLDAAKAMSRENHRMTRAHRYIVLALATAARKKSILNLTWDLVDLRSQLIRYDRLPGRRTKKRKVAVPLAEWAMPAMKQARREHTSELVLDHPGDIRKSLEAVCRRAAADTGNQRFLELNPHSLRHTAATHMVRAGVPLWQVAGVLGDTMATVERVYAHHAPDHLRNAVDAVGY